MKKKPFLVVGLLSAALIFVLASCATKGVEVSNSNEFADAVQNLAGDNFSGNYAIAAVEDCTISEEFYYSKGKPVNGDSLFQMASVGKFITAVGVMKLVEDNIISLDEPVENYLHSWQLPESKYNNSEVTVRRLLSHTAGLTDGLGYLGFNNKESLQTLEESLNYAKDSLPFRGKAAVGIEPGTEFRYSGGGYSLLQLMIEDVTGRSFNDYMRDEIFLPLGMESSTFIVDEDNESLSECYTSFGNARGYKYFTALAAASLFTTVNDLVKFANFNLAGKEDFLDLSTLQEMRNLAGPVGDYGFGLGVQLFDEEGSIFGHGGDNLPAVKTFIIINEKKKNALIVMKTGGTGSFVQKLVNTWLGWQLAN